jgi:AAA ATPase-like protein
MSASGPPPDSASWSHGRTRGPGLASGETPKSPAALVGRDRELAHVRELLEAARGGLTGALVIEGEAGIGKTTLLAAGEELADGFTCLWARGVESEAALGHAALLELLTPVQDRLADLPAAQAEALAAALGWGPAGAPGDRYLVAAATLSLLAAAAERAPVLVLVDDLHWVDRESAAALLFAARRLHRDAVAFLFAVRTGSASAVPLGGLSVLPLAGLAPAEAVGLLPARLADPVAAQLVERTRGNPLALSEVASRLTPAQLAGAAPLPDPLPVGAHLELVYEALLAGLSAPAWRAVLLCAAGPEGANPGLVGALAQGGLDTGAAIDEAEERGILVRDGGRVSFRHPLLRSAAWRLATPAQRRAAHLALAGALGGEAARAARTWHLAEAAAGRDDALAGELVALAEEDRTRRGFAAAAAALERAALLTTDPGLAAERLAAAVGDAFLAGDVERTRALAARVLEGPAGRAARAQVLYTLGVLEQYAGSVPRAAELLAAAAELADGPQRVWALAELGNTRFRLNDLAGVGEIADRLDEAADPGDPGQRALAAFARGVTLTVAGDPAPPAARLRAPDLSGDPSGPACGPRPLQPRGRGRPVPQPQDHRAPSGQRVPQARLPLPHRAGQRLRNSCRRTRLRGAKAPHDHGGAADSSKGCVLTPLCYRPSMAHPRQWDAKRLLRGAVPAQERKRPQDLIPNGMHPIGLAPEAQQPALGLVRGYVVGLPGLEPGTSSLSGFCPRACFPRITPAT